MRLSLIVRLFARSLGHQRRRALLTVVTVAWGTLSMVFLMAVAEGSKRSAERDFSTFGEVFAFVWPGKTSLPWHGWPPGRPVRCWPQDLPFMEAKLGREVTVCGTVSTSCLLKRGLVNASVDLRGVSPSYGHLRSHYPERGGRFLSERDLREKRRVIFLGDELATELFRKEAPLGQTVYVAGTPYTVIGVLQHKLTTGFDEESLDTRVAVIPISTFLAQFGEQPLGSLLVKPDSPSKMGATVASLRALLSGLYKFDPADERALHIWDRAEEAQDMRNMFTGILIFMGVIGAFTLLIGGVSVANILFTIVKERSHEIGVQMAIGARRREITVPILMEGFLYTLSGGVVGLGVGFLLVMLMDLIPTEQIKALAMIGHPTISWPIALSSVAILCVVGTLAGYFPARRAASLDPAETLRYE